MEQNLAILVQVYRDLLGYFPNKIKPTILDYNGKCIKIVRQGETEIPNIHKPEEPYNLVFYKIYAGNFGNRYVGKICIYEDESDVGFFPEDNE